MHNENTFVFVFAFGIVGAAILFPIVYTLVTRKKPQPDRFRDPLRSLVVAESLYETDGGVQFAVGMPLSGHGASSIEVVLQNCFDAPRTFVIDWRLHSGLKPVDLNLSRFEHVLAPLETGRLTIPFGPREHVSTPVATLMHMAFMVRGRDGTRLRSAKGKYVPSTQEGVSAAAGLASAIAALAVHQPLTATEFALRVDVDGGPVPARLPKWERIWAPQSGEIGAMLEQR